MIVGHPHHQGGASQSGRPDRPGDDLFVTDQQGRPLSGQVEHCWTGQLEGSASARKRLPYGHWNRQPLQENAGLSTPDDDCIPVRIGDSRRRRSRREAAGLWSCVVRSRSIAARRSRSWGGNDSGTKARIRTILPSRRSTSRQGSQNKSVDAVQLGTTLSGKTTTLAEEGPRLVLNGLRREDIRGAD